MESHMQPDYSKGFNDGYAEGLTRGTEVERRIVEAAEIYFRNQRELTRHGIDSIGTRLDGYYYALQGIVDQLIDAKDSNRAMGGVDYDRDHCPVSGCDEEAPKGVPGPPRIPGQ